MSTKWTSGQNESGILRKSEFKEKKEELLVFGYSCKLFRDDDKALEIDQGKHLIPWMGDETLKIDRYDGRGAMHDVSVHEAPPGGFDWRVELTKAELDVEQLCDEERYRALHTNEDEEEMYKEEELKRLHAAGYGQVGFNYDAPAKPETPAQAIEIDEPFLPSTSFRALLPIDIVLPETDKQNVIIEKTSKFIAEKGPQVEILIKARQADNPQFQFMNKESVLYPYYTALVGLIRSGKWPEKKPELVEEKLPENEDYLHPSLASTVIESAPSIPSIHYKPSADCDYTMLISKMRGGGGSEPYAAELAPGEEPPPGTEPLPPRHHATIQRPPLIYNHTEPPPPPALPAQVIQSQVYQQQYAAYYQQYMAQAQAQAAPLPSDRPTANPGPLRSTGLSLMKNYNTDSDSDVSDCDDTSSTDSKTAIIIKPPEEVQLVIDKMAAYVSRNGAEFADIVRAKRDPRFAFLEPSDVHHAYYLSRLAQMRPGEQEEPKKTKAPVSFSIKKLKEPDPILPKPALPYESSSEEETEQKTDKQDNKEDNTNKTNNGNKTNNTNIINNLQIANSIPQAVVYKMEAATENNLPIVKTIETIKAKPIIIKPVAPEVKMQKIEESLPRVVVQQPPKVEEVSKKIEKAPELKKSATPETKSDRKRLDSPNVEKREKERKKEKENRERRRSAEREKKRDDREKKKKPSKDEIESEIISLEDNSDEMIDLTGDHSDSKVECDTEGDRNKQGERRRRAAEFLKRVGVDPGAAALPTSSLASAMVDTLESLRKKKAEAEEKRRKREKRRQRDRYGDDTDKSHRKSKRRKYKSSDEEETDYDGSKKKKRRKEKKISKSKKKKKKEIFEEEEEEVMDHPLPPNIDLTNTLKELRTSSPTKELGLQDIEENSMPSRRESSSEDEEVNRRIKKKKEREYSEGEWSSDSEGDSESIPSKNGE